MALNPPHLDSFEAPIVNSDSFLAQAGPQNFLDHGFTTYSSSALLQHGPSASASPNDIVTSTAAHVASSVGYATKDDWGKHKTLIKRLYVNENNTLARVMRVMENQHNFRATIKMYKTKIKEWDLDKKNKEPEMRAVVRKRHERANQGKASKIRIRDQNVDFSEVARYWHRKGFSVDDVIARRTASPTPEAVELFTPVPSPMATPQTFAIPERILRCIADYFRGSFESGTWVKTEPEYICYSSKTTKIPNARMVEFARQCDLACRLFSVESYHEAGQTLIAATTSIKGILQAEEPETLIGLFCLHDVFRCAKRDEIAQAILRQFSSMGQLLLGYQHPLSLISGWLNLAPSYEVDDIISKCMESIVDHFDVALGSMHSSTLISRFRVLNSQGDEKLDFRTQQLQDLLCECEETLESSDIRVLEVRLNLAELFWTLERYDEAIRLALDVIAYSERSPRAGIELYQAHGLRILAQCQCSLGDFDHAIANLDAAINLGISALSPQDSSARNWLLELENMYIGQGHLDAAAHTRKRREESLMSMPED